MSGIEPAPPPCRTTAAHSPPHTYAEAPHHLVDDESDLKQLYTLEACLLDTLKPVYGHIDHPIVLYIYHTSVGPLWSQSAQSRISLI